LREPFILAWASCSGQIVEMNDPSSPTPIPTLQLGGIETHAGSLVQPPDGQLIYKLMTIENLARSIDGAYLRFTRVDQYSDSPIADPHDGQQLPADLAGNASARFQKAPEFSVAHYYERRVQQNDGERHERQVGVPAQRSPFARGTPYPGNKLTMREKSCRYSLSVSPRKFGSRFSAKAASIAAQSSGRRWRCAAGRITPSSRPK
jgi:hypothetical protein